MSDEKTEIVLAEKPKTEIMRPIVGVPELISAHREAIDLIAKALENGRDYGLIPGTGKKPVLLQPGGERLLKAFGCICDYEILEREIDHNARVEWTKKKKKWKNRFRGDKEFDWGVESGESLGLYRYVVKAIIKQRTPGYPIVGTSIGEASTMESKYVDRPRECANTVLKMAQKRAMVSAVKETFGLSDRFTVDLEDHQEDRESPPERVAEIDDRVPALVAEAVSKGQSMVTLGGFLRSIKIDRTDKATWLPDRVMQLAAWVISLAELPAVAPGDQDQLDIEAAAKKKIHVDDRTDPHRKIGPKGAVVVVNKIRSSGVLSDSATPMDYVEGILDPERINSLSDLTIEQRDIVMAALESAPKG